ncbi:hypothetical protein GJU40_08845 [Bacillus lacus]|uniref:Group-specific protein n=1 Tax=Metabacillus lacus TaxID=1983721 RepID=A0A7X2IYR1_9BACI|nr:hypothetical protein [Metabacillus lacus]MRX72257.1 hypothetical protein [Metabacillus lacus]
MEQKDKVDKIKHTAEEIVRTLLKDNYQPSDGELVRAVELLSRSVCDLSDVYLDDSVNHEETLKAALAKVKITYNAVSKNNTRNTSNAV